MPSTETTTDPTGRVRDLCDADVAGAVQLHQVVMAGGFLAGCGPAFLRCYYRAWMRSASAISLAASEPGTGRLIGLLLGSTDPASHYRSMVRHGGARLGARLIGRAIGHPAWGGDLIRRRGLRYIRGVLRMIPWRPKNVMAQLGHGVGCGEPSAARDGVTGSGSRRLGEITHLMVAPAAQGRGVGRALVEEACRRGERADLELMVVVTPPGWGAERFYRQLGWIRRGQVSSASDERFVRYEFRLPGRKAPAGGAPGGPVGTNRDSPASG
jgi:ribosomal protein S18 acetylase RimI-like enzyme